jgi:hypothetical protein
VEKRGKKVDYEKYYFEWLFGRKILTEIACNLEISVKKLTQEFDKIKVEEGLQVEAEFQAMILFA